MSAVLPIDTIIQGDCLSVLRGIPDNSVDACVTDPPYGLGEVKDIAGLMRAWLNDEDDSRFIGKSGFMGQGWDAGVPGPRYWREVYRVLKPGAHVLCFAGTRTQDLMSLSLRLAGFECRDTLVWVYGSGFPKSTAIDKQIDRVMGQERQILGISPNQRPAHRKGGAGFDKARGDGATTITLTEPTSEEAKRWQGFGSALKPAHEPILLFRKPLAVANLASNVLAWRTGGLAIDRCRVDNTGEEIGRLNRKGPYTSERTWNVSITPAADTRGNAEGKRWPPNFLLSHAACCTAQACSDDCPVRLLDEQAGERSTHGGGKHSNVNGSGQVYGLYGPKIPDQRFNGDSVPVSRFFPVFDMPVAYFPKASRRERNAGCEALPVQKSSKLGNGLVSNVGNGKPGHTESGDRQAANFHPCVKSLSLMSWLVRLVTPPDGIVLDPFAGSGSTLVACVQEGFHFIGMEQDESYIAIARARIAHAQRMPRPAKPAKPPKPRAVKPAQPAPLPPAPIPLATRRRKRALPPDVEQLALFG